MLVEFQGTSIKVTKTTFLLIFSLTCIIILESTFDLFLSFEKIDSIFLIESIFTARF